MTDRSHYRLNGTGQIEMTPAATPGPCIAYIIPGRDVLCVMEGAAYHQYKLDAPGMARLIAELGKRLWDKSKE